MGLSRTTWQHGDTVFNISAVVSLSGQTNDGTWLRELSLNAVAQEYHLILEDDGFSELSDVALSVSGFVSQFLGVGDDTDPL